MSLTTTSKRSASSIGSSASAASAADGPASASGGGGGNVSYSSAAVNLSPSRLDRLAPVLPGLDRDLVAAPGQRAREGDRRKRVSGVAEGGDRGTPCKIRFPARGAL